LKAIKAATAPRTRASDDAKRWPLLVLGTVLEEEVAEDEVFDVVEDPLEVEAEAEVDVVRVVELVRGVIVVEVRRAEEVVDLVSVDDEDPVVVVEAEAVVEVAVEELADAVPVPW
jgi:hypothetical protein